MFLDFNNKWEKVLNEFRIEPPLHMTEFIRPYGKHIGMYHELKLVEAGCGTPDRCGGVGVG